MQLDFMSVLHGIKSFENLRSDAVEVDFEGYKLKLASLKKIIQSKKALGRPKDKAVIDILEKTLDEQKKNKRKQLKALKKENERIVIEQIRRRLALPMNRRTHFLRKRLPGGGSCL